LSLFSAKSLFERLSLFLRTKWAWKMLKIAKVHNPSDGGCKREDIAGPPLPDPKTALSRREPCTVEKESIPPLPGEGSMHVPQVGNLT
jgi:hypothetical protein